MNSTIGAASNPRPRKIPVSAADKLLMSMVVDGPADVDPGAIVTMVPIVVVLKRSKSMPEKSTVVGEATRVDVTVPNNVVPVTGIVVVLVVVVVLEVVVVLLVVEVVVLVVGATTSA
jgi:hypothetical protein